MHILGPATETTDTLRISTAADNTATEHISIGFDKNVADTNPMARIGTEELDTETGEDTFILKLVVPIVIALRLKGGIRSDGRLSQTTSNPTNSSVLLVVQGLAGNANEQGVIRLQRGNNNGNNNRIGVIEFGGSDSAAAEIRGVGDGTWGADDYPGRLEFYTTADGNSSATERMRITSGGNVGIGDTSPDGKLHVGTGTNTDGTDIDIVIGGSTVNTRQSRIRKKIQSSDRALQVHAATGASDEDIAFFSDNTTERMRIHSTGQVSLGTNAPALPAILLI